jgi:hypothetical protein
MSKKLKFEKILFNLLPTSVRKYAYMFLFNFFKCILYLLLKLYVKNTPPNRFTYNIFKFTYKKQIFNQKKVFLLNSYVHFNT